LSHLQAGTTTTVVVRNVRKSYPRGIIPVAVRVPAMALLATDRWCRCWLRLCCCRLLVLLVGHAGAFCCLQPDCKGVVASASHRNLLDLRRVGPLCLWPWAMLLLFLVERPDCAPATGPRKICIQYEISERFFESEPGHWQPGGRGGTQASSFALTWVRRFLVQTQITNSFNQPHRARREHVETQHFQGLDHTSAVVVIRIIWRTACFHADICIVALTPVHYSRRRKFQ
jgi:hypothetical protein